MLTLLLTEGIAKLSNKYLILLLLPQKYQSCFYFNHHVFLNSRLEVFSQPEENHVFHGFHLLGLVWGYSVVYLMFHDKIKKPTMNWSNCLICLSLDVTLNSNFTVLLITNRHFFELCLHWQIFPMFDLTANISDFTLYLKTQLENQSMLKFFGCVWKHNFSTLFKTVLKYTINNVNEQILQHLCSSWKHYCKIL